MVGMLERVIGEDVDLVVAPADELYPVTADRGQLEQVILNLATNARDAMPHGGRLLLRTANVEVDEWFIGAQGAPAPGPYALLEVTDTGIGMDEATRSRIFEPFYTTKGPGRGTGLGLSTVYGIVQQSGGRVHVYSEPDQGTTFRIYLPRSVETASVAQEPVSAPAANGDETILVVEDNQGVRDLITQALGLLGYRTVVCVDGFDALQRIAGDGPIDLILIDVVMPRMGGVEFAQHAKRLFPKARVLFMSGYAEDAALLSGRATLDVPFIQKPFTLRQLGQMVRQVLDTQPA
jgi:CheY-like chemotaxis protein